MTTEQLKYYLGKIISLETSIYTQSEAIQSLEWQISRLANRKRFTMPAPPQTYEAEVHLFFPLFLGFIVGSPVGLILSLFGPVFEAIGYGVMILMPALSFLYFDKKEKIKAEELTRKETSRHKAEMRRFDQKILDDMERVSAEEFRKNDLIAVQNELKQQCVETRNILRHYYSQNILFSKYQNFIAVCSLYEYLMSGRCTALEGHEGAYNLFETELRLDRICGKLDTVIDHLSDIKDNQAVLYDAIQEGNRASKRLYQEAVKQSELLGMMEEKIALTGEYARIAASNAEAGAWIGLANYVK